MKKIFNKRQSLITVQDPTLVIDGQYLWSPELDVLLNPAAFAAPMQRKTSVVYGLQQKPSVNKKNDFVYGGLQSKPSVNKKTNADSANNAQDANGPVGVVRLGVEMLKAAIESEKQGSYKSARDMYLEAAENFTSFRAVQGDDNSTRVLGLKVAEFRQRAQQLTQDRHLPPPHNIKGSAEYSVLYIGTYADTDWKCASSRTELLTAIDKNKSSFPNSAKKSVITLSIYGVKLTDRNLLPLADPMPFMRQTLQNICSVACVDDDGDAMVVIKIGQAHQQNKISTIVLQCAIVNDGIEICSLLRHLVEDAYRNASPQDSVYIDAVMPPIVTRKPTTIGLEPAAQKLQSQRSIVQAAPVAAVTLETFMSPRRESMKQSMAKAASTEGIYIEASNHQPYSSDPIIQTSASLHNISTTEMVNNYMVELRKVLNLEEMRQFAQLLKAYRGGMELNQFCAKAQALFGEQRLYMLPNMRAFITKEQMDKFESYIQKNVPKDVAGRAIPVAPPSPSMVRRASALKVSPDGKSKPRVPVAVALPAPILEEPVVTGPFAPPPIPPPLPPQITFDIEAPPSRLPSPPKRNSGVLEPPPPLPTKRSTGSLALSPYAPPLTLPSPPPPHADILRSKSPVNLARSPEPVDNKRSSIVEPVLFPGSEVPKPSLQPPLVDEPPLARPFKSDFDPLDVMSPPRARRINTPTQLPNTSSEPARPDFLKQLRKTGLIELHETKAKETEDRIRDVASPPPTKPDTPRQSKTGPTEPTKNWKDLVAERKLQKEQQEREAEERLKREEEAKWHNIPEWKKMVIEKQAKKLQELEKTDPDLIALKKQQVLKEKIAQLPPWKQELMKKKLQMDFDPATE